MWYWDSYELPTIYALYIDLRQELQCIQLVKIWGYVLPINTYNDINVDTEIPNSGQI